MELIEEHASLGGWQNVCQHYSRSLKCETNADVYLPPKVENEKSLVLYWLSSLTCNEQGFVTKSRMQRYAAGHSIIIVVPDTSPRGSRVTDAGRYGLGQGAGFYLNAMQALWSEHYKVHDYIRNELPNLVIHHFPAAARESTSGHSTGRLGTLMLVLRSPGEYASVSASSPIVSPSQTPWERQAFATYLGKSKGAWLDYDPANPTSQGQRATEIMVDQGLGDDFYAEQLRTSNPEKICQEMNTKTLTRYHEGCDHSYYFVSNFIGKHIAYYASKLNIR